MPRPNQPQNATTAVAQQQQQADQRTATVARYLADLTPQIARALPRGMNADRVTRLALTTVRKSVLEAAKRGDITKSLAYCTPESFAGALLTASALGLEPDVNGEAYLVPYMGECTFIPGYQGLAKLFYQHPLARQLDCEAVRDGDHFEYRKGTQPFLDHRPTLGNKGPIVAYYAVATLTTGAVAFVVLTPDEVKALRGGKEGPSGRIPDPQKWMERKTVLRQLFKLLPKSTTLQVALDADERSGTELYRDRLTDAGVEPARIEGPAVPAGVDPTTGEVTVEDPPDTFNVQDPPGYDPGQEPPSWRNQDGGAR